VAVDIVGHATCLCIGKFAGADSIADALGQFRSEADRVWLLIDGYIWEPSVYLSLFVGSSRSFAILSIEIADKGDGADHVGWEVFSEVEEIGDRRLGIRICGKFERFHIVIQIGHGLDGFCDLVLAPGAGRLEGQVHGVVCGGQLRRELAVVGL
jgi:hypothetical protein